MKGKRLLLLKEVLDDLQYPDKIIGGRNCKWLHSARWMTESDVFSKNHIEIVKSMAKGLNQNKQVCGTADDELSRKT